MVDSLQAETATQGVVGRDRKRVGAPGGRVPAAIAFLEAALAGGAVAVAELEVHARAAGLVGERQRVSDAKTFKAAKKKLGIMSRRDGFGRAGEWSWGLPTIRTVKPAEMAADLAPKVPTLVIYADHSRPDDHDLLADHAQDDRLKGAPVLLEWIRGVARLDLGRAPRDVPPTSGSSLSAIARPS